MEGSDGRRGHVDYISQSNVNRSEGLNIFATVDGREHLKQAQGKCCRKFSFLVSTRGLRMTYPMLCPHSLLFALYVLFITDLQGGRHSIGIGTRLEDSNFSNTGGGPTCDPQKRAESVNRFRIKRHNRCYDKKVVDHGCPT